MSDQALINTLKTLGYDNATIKRIMAAAEAEPAVKSVRATAERRGLTELPSPMAAAAESAQKASLIRQIAGQIKNATGFKYHLPMNERVDVDQLTIALVKANAPIDARLAIRENLFRAGLIPA